MRRRSVEVVILTAAILIFTSTLVQSPGEAQTSTLDSSKVVTPFRKELLSDTLWTGFEEADPVLAIYRAEKVSFAKTEVKCAGALAKLSNQRLGEKSGIAVWQPFQKEERALVEECTQFPCKVKLNSREVEALKAAPKEERLKHYMDLVSARVNEAQKTGKRGGYELPEPALDGWSWLRGRRDFRLAPPPSGELVGRRLDLAKKGGYLEIRQILEQRVSITADRYHLWARDLYTDHYFDSWSEEVDFVCVNENEGILSQAMVIEIDLLKNQALFARMMNPKLRHGVREAALKVMRERRENWIPDSSGITSR